MGSKPIPTSDKSIEKMENILISACLLGLATRYDGDSREYPAVELLREKYNLIPFCPEIYGGLPTPRTPSERCGARVITKLGEDVTEKYEKGAREAYRMAKLFRCRIAVFKERSPACATHEIYDGNFSGKRITGMGVASEYLSRRGITVVSEDEIMALLAKND